MQEVEGVVDQLVRWQVEGPMSEYVRLKVDKVEDEVKGCSGVRSEVVET